MHGKRHSLNLACECVLGGLLAPLRSDHLEIGRIFCRHEIHFVPRVRASEVARRIGNGGNIARHFGPKHLQCYSTAASSCVRDRK